MINIQSAQRVSGIHHPLVRDIYLKQDASFTNKDRRVLVIEAKGTKSGNDHESFEDCLMDLLVDLRDIQAQAQEKVGPFARVDIQMH